MRPPIDTALAAGRRRDAADAIGRATGPCRAGLILGTAVPIARRVAAVLPGLALPWVECRSGAAAQLGNLAGLAIEAADFADATRRAVFDAETALLRARPLRINRPIRPEIDAALATIRAYCREVEP